MSSWFQNLHKRKLSRENFIEDLQVASRTVVILDDSVEELEHINEALNPVEDVFHSTLRLDDCLIILYFILTLPVPSAVLPQLLLISTLRSSFLPLSYPNHEITIEILSNLL